MVDDERSPSKESALQQLGNVGATYKKQLCKGQYQKGASLKKTPHTMTHERKLEKASQLKPHLDFEFFAHLLYHLVVHYTLILTATHRSQLFQ